ncbi:hypothetical protein BGZ63DRAFT_242660 [Mariannaea sp. PMI_226]|nr:hypothetical protein BGZ63DRAFT_242660 [Mariannaea sp. PMI_226]
MIREPPPRLVGFEKISMDLLAGQNLDTCDMMMCVNSEGRRKVTYLAKLISHLPEAMRLRPSPSPSPVTTHPTLLSEKSRTVEPIVLGGAPSSLSSPTRPSRQNPVSSSSVSATSASGLGISDIVTSVSLLVSFFFFSLNARQTGVPEAAL